MPDIFSFGKHPDYMGTIDLADCPNGEVTLTIASITEKAVSNGRGEQSKESICAWKEKGWQPMILNVTNKKTLVRLLTTKDTAKMIGKRVTITTEHGRWFGKEGDALRIKPILPRQDAPSKASPAQNGTAQSDAAQSAPVCSDCGKPISGASGMDAAQVAAYTAKKYGRALCADCASKAAKGGTE